MRIFEAKGSVLSEISETQFALERDLQHLIEENLQAIFRLEFVRSEFELNGLRIDTLAFDKESNAFVIIEYKKERNFSVIDQGMEYLYLMLNNGADFILEYNQKFLPNLKREDVDWTQSRVIFISPEFTRRQQHAIGFKNFAVELWKVHKYKNDFVVLDKLESPDIKESITTIVKGNPVARRVSREIKVYDESDHLNKVDQKIRKMYATVKFGIQSLGDNIEMKPKKQYVGFWHRQLLFATIKFPKGKLRIKLNNRMYQNLKTLQSSQNLVRTAVLCYTYLQKIRFHMP